MIEIRNLLSQPLTFQLAGEEQGLHLRSRQRKQVEDAQVSEEMRTAAKAGFVILTELEQPDGPEARPMAAETADGSSDTAVQPGEEPAAEDGGSSVETKEQPTETTSETTPRKRR